MKHVDLERKLLENGFRLIRSNKHEIWSNGKVIITLPFHKEINYFTGKTILKQIAKGA